MSILVMVVMLMMLKVMVTNISDGDDVERLPCTAASLGEGAYSDDKEERERKIERKVCFQY